MKKFIYLAFAAAALCGASSASAQEVTYVEDCSQGLLMNQNKNNWFMTVQGGANVLISKYDNKADFSDRIGPDAALYFGKWVSPSFGVRFGANWVMPKGATTATGDFRKMNAAPLANGYYPEKFMGIGGEVDLLVNLTNWWCGYKPNRVYNAVVHAGAGARFNLRRAYKGDNLEWRSSGNDCMIASLGLQNNFAVSRRVNLFIDLACEGIDFGRVAWLPEVNLGLTVNFGKTDWNCPVTAVCPTWKYTDAEGDALVARLNQANDKIADLQNQLDACLKRPVQTVVDCEGLCTVYYPINKSNLTAREKGILRSVAEVMNANPNQKYVLTGWADNYTGNEEINVRLRHARVDGVKNYLVSCGVAESQLDATIDNNNLTDFGAKAAPLDRAVTIKEAK